MNWQRDGYELTDEKKLLQVDVICALLHSTYWAAERPRDLIEKSIQHSICFGLFRGNQQVGFTRAVTDFATFAWICDVVIAPEHRSHGLGKWIMECVLAHPDLKTSTLVLRTRNAHSLYEKFGFERTEYLRRSANDWSKKRPAN